jgi:hypothetical protein
MITLTIKKKDGSIYWVENFNDLAAANLWLLEEEKKFYWDPTYTHTMIDDTPSAEDLTAAAAAAAGAATATAALRASALTKLRGDIYQPLTYPETLALFGQ